MRLSEWRKAAPSKESLGGPVLGVLKSVLMDLGAEADPECWVVWGDDPGLRYSVLAPTIAGLIIVAVRLSSPDQGPRATGKLIRWPKLSVSELGIEASGEHRIVVVQVESLVLKGTDEEADRVCEFVRGLIAGLDGRNPVPIPITVVQGAATAGAVAVAAPETAVQASAPTQAGIVLEPPPAASRPPAEPRQKPAVDPEPTVVSRPATAVSAASHTPARPTARSDRKTAPSHPGLALVPVLAPAARPAALPAAPPAAPDPIAARAHAVQPGARPGTARGLSAHEFPEPEPERPARISPDPGEKPPPRDPKRPRPWTP